MPDGQQLQPGAGTEPAGSREPRGLVETLRAVGVRFRNDIVIGNDGKQILLDDPSGNPIELFEPRRG